MVNRMNRLGQLPSKMRHDIKAEDSGKTTTDEEDEIKPSLESKSNNKLQLIEKLLEDKEDAEEKI